MALSTSKVVIVGVGNVGKALAHQLVIQQSCDELVLIDRDHEKVWAEVTDLNHSLGYSDTKMKVSQGDYSACANADIVVLSVSAPYKVGMNRLDMFDSATNIIKQIVPEIMKSGFKGIFVVITNPVDAMTYLVHKLSALPANQVIGTGTSLDSARLRVYLAELIGVDPRSVDALCMGEHGDSQMIPWSQVSVGAKKFYEILDDNPQRLKNVNVENIKNEITQIAYDVVERKGATNYGIASVASTIIKAIIKDVHTVMPVSTQLNGEYGFHDVFIGVPAVINRNGIKEIVTYHLSDDEMNQFKKSVDVLQTLIKKF